MKLSDVRSAGTVVRTFDSVCFGLTTASWSKIDIQIPDRNHRA